MVANIQANVVAVGLVTSFFQTESIDPKTRQMILRLFSSPRWTRCL
jgi:hypothetical protein